MRGDHSNGRYHVLGRRHSDDAGKPGAEKFARRVWRGAFEKGQLHSSSGAYPTQVYQEISSGVSEHRLILAAVFEAAREGKFEISLLLYVFDRLAREYVLQASPVKLFEETGVTVERVREPLAGNTEYRYVSHIHSCNNCRDRTGKNSSPITTRKTRSKRAEGAISNGTNSFS